MTKTQLNLVTDLVLFAALFGLTMTGGILQFVLPSGTGPSLRLFGLDRHDIGAVHFYLALFVVILLAVHLFLHWHWISCIMGKPFGHPKPSRRRRTVWGVAFIAVTALVLVLGLLAMSTVVEQRADNWRDKSFQGKQRRQRR